MGNVLWHEKDNAGRGPSGGVWTLGGGCPWDDILANPNLGYVYDDDFIDLPTGKYTATQATTGTFALVGGDGGLVEADSAATATDRGINVQIPVAAFLPAAGRKIWYECRCKVIDLVTDAQLFVGLSEIDTSIFATGENSSANHIGFEANATSIAANPGKLQFVGEKAGARGTVANVKTMAEDTFFKVGFFVDGVTSVTCVVDGVQNATKLATANVPIVVMAPSFACLGEFAGSSDPILTIDWARCAVKF